MTLQLTQDAPVTERGDEVIPVTVLESLACRFRPSGLFLVLFRPDGSIAWWDESAGLFFTRYVLPGLMNQAADGTLPRWVKDQTAASTVNTSKLLPGVVASVFPHVERRQLRGVVALMGKSGPLRLTEDVLRVCGRLGIDGIWLSQQAERLDAHEPESVQRQARLLLTMIRDQARIAVMEEEIAGLSTQLANTYEELSLIHSISGGMRINRGVYDFFKQVCLDLLQVTRIRGLGVSLQRVNGQLDQPHMFGPLDLPPPLLLRLSEQLLERLARQPGPLFIQDLSADEQLNWLEMHAHQLLAVPLQRQDQVLGCLFAFDKFGADFDSTDSKLLGAIASQCAVYMQNALLFEDVHGLMMGLLHSLTSAVDAKDAYTCGHSERVALLARELATEAGLAGHVVERVYIAGLLHDVGKIGVPESVLSKSGRLTPEEFVMMKRHPQIGARILRNIKQVADILPGVLHHHERFDGKGYPHGLAGQGIPLMGRILCLADAFDAMTSTRTYRKALPLEVALTEIRRCAGTQFDPALAEGFLRIGVERLRELLKKHEETRVIEQEAAAQMAAA